MRGVFGLLGLIVVLGIIAVTVKHQLQGTRVPAPAAMAGSAPADGGLAGAPALPAVPAGSAAKQYQADLRDAMQQQADQRGRGADADGGH